jgi:hypothetical protein
MEVPRQSGVAVKTLGIAVSVGSSANEAIPESGRSCSEVRHAAVIKASKLGVTDRASHYDHEFFEKP